MLPERSTTIMMLSGVGAAGGLTHNGGKDVGWLCCRQPGTPGRVDSAAPTTRPTASNRADPELPPA